jgi:glycosyltransferase involved in cell wall biosynthesis
VATFSILMNCYNCEKYLREAIDSIYAQTFEDWEIVFIDNSSKDRSPEVAKSYDSRVKYYQTPQFMSLGEARNFGLQFCKGKYLTFLDTDDMWFPFKLEEQFKILEGDDSFQMCYSSVMFMNERSEDVAKLVAVAKSGDVLQQQLLRYEINMQSVAIRNNIELSFNTEMEFSPDYDLFMSIASRHRVAVISEPLIRYRKVANSLTNKKIGRWWIEQKMTLDKIFEEQPRLKDKYSDEVDNAYAKVCYFRARHLMEIGNKSGAREQLEKYKFFNKIYFLLYLSSYSKALWKFIHIFK